MPIREPVRERARAKVNLTLRVRGRRSDGYHELESLVAFADSGDTVGIEPDAPDRLAVSGPFAHDIAGENLLTRAIALLRAAEPRLRIGSVHLDKRLPVAAGLGGGSADAAALLRAVRRANPELADAIPWIDIAERLGSDVPVCLADHPALISGRGERMSPVAFLPQVGAVLVNPLVPLATGSVFAALRSGPVPAIPGAPEPPILPDPAGLLDYMRQRGNDMEAAAIGLLPAIAEIKTLIASQPGCGLAAMSGSGPTCFGVFARPADADRAAASIATARPGWWVQPTVLGGLPRTPPADTGVAP